MKKLYSHIVKHSKAYFLGTIITMILLITQLSNPGYDGTFNSIGIQESRYVKDLQYIHDVFSEEQKVVLQVEPKNQDFYQVTQDMKRLEEALQRQFDSLSFRSVVKASPVLFTEAKMKEMDVETALASFSKITYLKDLISKDKKSFLVVLGIEKDESKVIVDKVDNALAKTGFREGYKINVTSRFHIEDSINSILESDLRKIIVALVATFILIVLLAFRSFYAIFYILSIVICSVLIALFVFIQFDYPFNLVTLIIAPVIIVLAAADSIHLLTAYRTQASEISHEEKMKNIYSKYFVPSFLTSLTTSVAFLSLAFNDTSSVVLLGMVTAITVLFSFAFCYTISPYLLWLSPKSKAVNPLFFRFSNFFIKRKKGFTFALIPILIVAFFMLPSLKFQNDFEIFLPLNSQSKLEHDAIKSSFYSQSTLEVVLNFEEEGEHLEELNLLNDSLTTLDGVNTVMSYLSTIPIMSKFGIPIDLAAFSGYKRKFSVDGGKIQRLLIRLSDPNIAPQLEPQIIAILESVDTERYFLTGSALVVSYVNFEVGRSLVKSLFTSCVFLFLMFFILTRSVVQAAIGLFANLVPLSLIVILFVAFDQHINIVSSITAVVCLGIIVDDTIHSFYRKVILKQELGELGFGMLTTTIILFVGFGLFGLSSIKPVLIFGSVASIVFVITLIADYTLLLYLLERYDAWVEKKIQK